MDLRIGFSLGGACYLGSKACPIVIDDDHEDQGQKTESPAALQGREEEPPVAIHRQMDEPSLELGGSATEEPRILWAVPGPGAYGTLPGNVSVSRSLVGKPRYRALVSLFFQLAAEQKVQHIRVIREEMARGLTPFRHNWCPPSYPLDEPRFMVLEELNHMARVLGPRPRDNPGAWRRAYKEEASRVKAIREEAITILEQYCHGMTIALAEMRGYLLGISRRTHYPHL